MSNKLATPGIIWLADGTPSDDVSWMIENMTDGEVASLTDEKLKQIAQANAIVAQANGETIDDEDVADAAATLRRIITNRAK